MIVDSDGNLIFVRKLLNGINPQLPPIIFLHGFMGNSTDWNFVAGKLNLNCSLYAIDFIGHGKSSAPDDEKQYTYTSINSHLISVMDKLKLQKAILAGYSMGGRAALGFAIENANRVEALILESTTAGIEDKEERLKRIKSDELTSEKIRKGSLQTFLISWYEADLFKSLNKNFELLKNEIEIKKKNNHIGISNCVKGFSPGKMPSYWSKLGSIQIPVLQIVGELDNKYVQLNTKMKECLPNSTLKIVLGVSHNTHLEKPQEFTNFVNHFLVNHFKI
ncbi:MAG: 2-succinyl-6-hydroxy-2,4-cyclohexadiene-1-carboxylate synthase [Melioribacteraceae bacterium]|nr:2-succinyl-6-hydroxy-2,4-cyclohexadiene-1-carboxylate synthase [Melioribacteraceae bacterium]